MDKTVANSINTVLGTYAAKIKATKDLEKAAIAKIIKSLPEYKILTSIPNIGDVYVAGIIAEVGQIDRFSTETKLAKYSGLAWNQKQSGDYASSYTPVSLRK